MNSKECLEDIKLILYENLEFHMDVDELIEPIKQDLNRLEELEKENEKLKCKIHDLLDEKLELVLNNHNQSMGIAELMKKFIEFKKIIEILKDILIVEDFTREDGSHKYYMCRRNVFPVFTMNLTKEQYDFLKEVLGNE